MIAIINNHPKEKAIKEKGLQLHLRPLTIFDSHYLRSFFHFFLSKYTTSSIAKSSSKQLRFGDYQITLSNKRRDLSFNEA
jgi:hypothetical protein